MELGELHFPVPSPPEKQPRYQLKKGVWVGPLAGLDVLKKNLQPRPGFKPSTV